MFDIRNYGPKKITLSEVKRGTREVVEQEHNVMPLSEASLNQMMEHGKTGMVILSANRSAIRSTDPRLDLTAEFEADMEDRYGSVDRIDSDALMGEMGDWLRERNARRDRELKNDIKSAGYSYTPVFGGYHGKDGTVDSYEPSYVVYAHDRSGEPVDFQELVEFALEMCRKYDQESVYVQGPGKPPMYLDSEGDRVDTSSTDRFRLNRDDEEFFTTTSRDKTSPQRFTADIVFESMFVQLRPASYNENMRRLKSGEYIL